MKGEKFAPNFLAPFWSENGWISGCGLCFSLVFFCARNDGFRSFALKFVDKASTSTHFLRTEEFILIFLFYSI